MIPATHATLPASTRGNLLQLHQDFPNMWDAWDVDRHYRGMVEDLDDADDVRLDGDAVVVTRTFGSSRIEQRLFLADDARTLVIDNTVDWHETEKFLKLAFPVDVFTDAAVAAIESGEEAINQRTLLLAPYVGPTERRRMFERELA